MELLLLTVFEGLRTIFPLLLSLGIYFWLKTIIPGLVRIKQLIQLLLAFGQLCGEFNLAYLTF